MKNYYFRIEVDEIRKETLKRKTFILKLKNEIHPYDMFEEARDHIYNNVEEYFNLDPEDNLDFKIIRGNKKAFFSLESDYCPQCGGSTEIWGGYDA